MVGAYLHNSHKAIQYPISVHMENKITVINLPSSKVGSLMKKAPIITPTMINILKNQNLQKICTDYQ